MQPHQWPVDAGLRRETVGGSVAGRRCELVPGLPLRVCADVRFTRIDGEPRNSVAELSRDGGAVPDSWIAPVGGSRLLLAPERIYLAPRRYGVVAYPLNIGDRIFATHFD